MGLTLNWFKNYEILKTVDDDNDYVLRLLDHDEYDHCYKTVSDLSDLMSKHTGFIIPRLPVEYEIEADTKLNLIPPELMSEICETVLQHTDKNDTLVTTIEHLKKLSDQRYYLAYDNE